MRIRTQRKQYVRTITQWMIGSSLFLAILAGAYWYISRDVSPIPAPIRSQLTFSPFVVPKNSHSYATSDYTFNTVENNERILSYIIQLNPGSVTVSEYVQPAAFSEIPEYKDRFLSNVIKQYATVQTSNGTIYLGRLSKQNDRQLAIMIEKGLLVFLSPNKDLDEVQWRKIGDQLEVQKITN